MGGEGREGEEGVEWSGRREERENLKTIAQLDFSKKFSRLVSD